MLSIAFMFSEVRFTRNFNGGIVTLCPGVEASRCLLYYRLYKRFRSVFRG